MIRQPAVAGQFYSASPDTLASDVARYLDSLASPQPAIAVVSPHAGLMYSGHVAGAVYAKVSIPSTVILIGPNHSGIGPPLSLYPSGAWMIPGGAVRVDHGLVSAILAEFPRAEADTSAHLHEHCLEVQLPFLHRLRPDLHIVPIVLGHTPETVYEEFGLCLARIIRDRADRQAGEAWPLLVASTDLTHYEPDSIVRAKDHHAIGAVQRLDPAGLSAAVRQHRITMCGFGATLTILHTARALGALSGTLIRYATSGDITGEHDQVVGYAGLTIT
jgi:AmmeMemoRadiSam system protein B